ncbi:MAG: hypothetical protein JW837_02860 [Sedimentisphaerales bacterium]|nr:hypothetical protein [Sedimentisphaerales bacterium]
MPGTRKKQLVILIMVFCASIFTTGAKKSKSSGLGTVEGMIKYLKTRRIPTLENIEPWENQYGPGLILTTEHYTIYTTLLDPLMLIRVPGFVESAHNAYQKQLPEPVKTHFKLPIYLFKNRKQWEEFTKTFTGKNHKTYLKIKAGAYCLNDACVAYNIGSDVTFSVLGHEGWHQFNQRHFKYRLPSWLDEGIAMMFEANEYKDGLFTFDASRNFNRLGGLKVTLLNNNTIPLKFLIGLNPGQTVYAGDKATMAFYCQSYALVRFLKEDDYGKRLANYYQMLNGAADGSWPLSDEAKRIATDRNIPLTVNYNRIVGTKLFEYYIGEDFETIEQQYIIFCKKLVYHVRLKSEQ